MTIRKVPVLDTDDKIKVSDLGTGAAPNKVLYGDKTWRVPGSGSVNIKQIEIDFGVIPVFEKEFTVVDSDVLITSKILGNIAYEIPTSKDLDEVEMDSIDLKFKSGNGEFKVYCKGLDGYLEGCFKVNYLIG